MYNAEKETADCSANHSRGQPTVHKALYTSRRVAKRKPMWKFQLKGPVWSFLHKPYKGHSKHVEEAALATRDENEPLWVCECRKTNTAHHP